MSLTSSDLELIMDGNDDYRSRLRAQVYRKSHLRY